MTHVEKKQLVDKCETGVVLPIWKIRSLTSCNKPVLRMIAGAANASKPDLPPFTTGDTFFIQERWTLNHSSSAGAQVIYRSDFSRQDLKSAKYASLTWNRPADMPKEYARHFFQVTDIRLERIQDAKADDLIKEGVSICSQINECFNSCQYCNKPGSPKQQYKNIWNTILLNKRDQYCYEDNPWTWVIYLSKLA